MGLLKTILGIVLFYYAFKFIARIFFPYLLKIFVSKAQQNMQDKFSQQQSGQQEEGEVRIKSKQQSKIHQVEAEDVDFEDVE
jgi:UPF0716 family protein affecting phage T7 exclusion